MKKFLSALIALTMAVAPTGNNICGAEGTAYLVKKQSVNKEQKNEVLEKISEVSKKFSTSIKSFKEVVKEHGKEIGLGVAGTASAGLLTWNSYNLVKNSDKIKEILADTTLSFKEKVQAIVKVMFCGVKKVIKVEEAKNVEEQKTEEVKAEIKAEEARKAEEDRKAKEEAVKEAEKNLKAAEKAELNAQNGGNETSFNKTHARVVEATEKLDEAERILDKTNSGFNFGDKISKWTRSSWSSIKNGYNYAKNKTITYCNDRKKAAEEKSKIDAKARNICYGKRGQLTSCLTKSRDWCCIYSETKLLKSYYGSYKKALNDCKSQNGELSRKCPDYHDFCCYQRVIHEEPIKG